MRQFKNSLILLGHKSIGDFSLVNNLGQLFYSYVLVPTISFVLRAKHKNLLQIKIRNSVNDKGVFKLFLSDIDTSLIIKDGSDSGDLIRDYLRLKKIFIMLDFPEIYTSSENNFYDELKKLNSWKIVEVFWNIRKINWCRAALLTDASELNQIKMKKSIARAFSKVTKIQVGLEQRQLFLSDLKYMNLLMDTTKKDIAICSYSDFLGNNNSYGVFIETSWDQFLFFNNLFPGDKLLQHRESEKSEFYKECKKSIEQHEKLITLSVIRLKNACGESSERHQSWLKHLDSLIEAHV